MSTQQAVPAVQPQADARIRRNWVSSLLQRWGLKGEWLVTAALVYIAFILFVAVLKRGTFWDRGIMTAAVASFSMPSYFLALLLVLLFSLKLRWTSIVAGVSLGAIAALKRGTFWDRGIMTAAVASFSMPSYFLALLLVLLFSLKLRWLPTAGAETWKHLILPATTLGLTLSGSIARFTRSAMLEVLRQSYMRTARAKGAPKWRQIAWHALPNAAIPTVTVIGFQLGWLIGGSVVIETVFAWPGAGRLFITSIGVRDFAVVQMFISWHR